MKLKKLLRASIVTVIIALLTAFQPALAQNGARMGAGTGTADPSAILDLVSPSKGLLLPRVNLVAVNNGTAPIASPATGLLVYNLGGGGVSSVGLYYWSGTEWAQLTAGGFTGTGIVDYATRWTTSSTIGTGVIVDNGTNVGIGTTTPGTKLDVAGTIRSSTGGLISEINSNEGGQLTLSNPGKTGASAPAWTFFNMTGGYGNSLQFYNYPADNVPGCCVSRFRINDDGTTVLAPSGGNVGVGGNPSARLHITGTAGTDGLMFPDGTQQTSAAKTSFVNWGRNDCPAGTSIIYAGYVAGSFYHSSIPGGGANTLCLTNTPNWTGANVSDANQDGGRIYGMEFEFSGYGVATYGGTAAASFQNYEAVCAVCLVENASATIMVPGTVVCPSGWYIQHYWGYLVSTYYAGNQRKSEFVCMINNPMITGSNADSNGSLWYPVEKEAGSMNAAYVTNREITCSVCSR